MMEENKPSTLKKLSGLILLIRIPNLVIIALILVLLRYAVAEPFLTREGTGSIYSAAPFILFMMTSLLLAAGGYVINNYFDVRTDEVNDPDKLLVTRIFSVRETILIYRGLTALALISGFILGWMLDTLWFGLVFASIAVLFWFYSSLWKTYLIWKNLIVALLSAVLFVIAWLFEFYSLRMDPRHFSSTIGSMKTVTNIYFAYAGFSFLYTLAREIIKDMEDLPGDREAGIRTMPVVFGIRIPGMTAVTLIIVAIALLAWFQAELWSNGMRFFFWYLLIAVQAPSIYLVLQLFRAKERAGFGFASAITKMIIVAGVFSILFTSMLFRSL